MTTILFTMQPDVYMNAWLKSRNTSDMTGSFNVKVKLPSLSSSSGVCVCWSDISCVYLSVNDLLFGFDHRLHFCVVPL